MKEQNKLKSFHKDLDKIEKQIVIPANTLKVGDIMKFGDPIREQNKVMSAEEASKNYSKNKSSSEVFRMNHEIDFLEGAKWYEQNTLSQRIDELAEKIVKSGYYKTAIGQELWEITEPEQILKTANDYKTELNLNK